MLPPESIQQKVLNALRFVNARPELFIAVKIRNIIDKLAQRVEVEPEEARDLLEWHEQDTAIQPDIRFQLIGKEVGYRWLKALAKKAAPKPTNESLIKNLKKAVDEGLEEIKGFKPQISRGSGGAGSPGAPGDDAWTPELAIVTYLSGAYMQVVGWFGGSGTEPESGQYIGPSGFVTNIEDATNIRGPSGGGGGDTFQNLFFQESVGVPSVPDGADTSDYFLVYQKIGEVGDDSIFHQYIWIP